MKKLLMLMSFLLMSFNLFAQDELDRPVATVKLYSTEVITRTQLNNAIRIIEAQQGTTLTAEERKYVLDNMIYEKLIMQAAKEEGINYSDEDLIQAAIARLSQQMGVPVTREDFRDSIEQQGIRFEDYIEISRKQVIMNEYIMSKKGDYIQGTPKPTEEEIQTFYEANETNFIQPALLRFSHVFYNTRSQSNSEQQITKEKAEQDYFRIQSGTSFESLLANTPNSVPEIPNGDMGYVTRSSQQVAYLLGTDFLSKIFQLETGDTALIKSQLGYHIVKITEKIDKKFLSLDDPISPGNPITVHQQIYNEMYNYMIQLIFQEASQEIIQELLDNENTEIQYFEDNF